MFRSSVKYAANILSNLKQKEDQPLPSNQLLAYWITETQRGLVRNKISYKFTLLIPRTGRFL